MPPSFTPRPNYPLPLDSRLHFAHSGDALDGKKVTACAFSRSTSSIIRHDAATLSTRAPSLSANLVMAHLAHVPSCSISVWFSRSPARPVHCHSASRSPSRPGVFRPSSPFSLASSSVRQYTISLNTSLPSGDLPCTPQPHPSRG